MHYKKNNQYAITYNNAQIQATDQKQMKNKKSIQIQRVDMKHIQPV